MATKTKEKPPKKTARQLWAETHPDMCPPAERLKDFTIVLPALDEDDSLKRLLPKLEPYYTVCIRDDPGLANAIVNGILMSPTKYVIVMDADGTHATWTVHQMVRLIQEGSYDMVCGVRERWSSSLQDQFSYYGNNFIRHRLQIPIRDCTSGFFAARKDKLLQLPANVWTGYGDFYMELLARAVRQDWSIAQVSTDYLPRQAGTSHTSLKKSVWQYFQRVRSIEKALKQEAKLLAEGVE